MYRARSLLRCFSCPRDPEKISCLTFTRERNKVSLIQSERSSNRLQNRNALQLWSIFEWHLNNELKRGSSGSHSQESVRQDKMTKVLNLNNVPWLVWKGYHNIQPRLQEKLKKESHKTLLFWVDFHEKIALLAIVFDRDMDIKTLLYINLREEEVFCLVCSDIFTDPEHMPCLHSFYCICSFFSDKSCRSKCYFHLMNSSNNRNWRPKAKTRAGH